MYCIKELIKHLETIAPLALAEQWDNVGLMIGSYKSYVQRVLCALDVTEKVIQEAIEQKIDCIVTHHPFFFTSLKQIDYDTAKGKMIRQLIKEDIAVYSMHTNLDSAQEGINDILADLLGIEKRYPLHQTATHNTYEGIGRYGTIQPTTLKNLALQMKHLLNTPYVRIVGDEEVLVENIALCSGSGSEYIKQAAKVAQAYITADVKFHEAQAAQEQGLCLIDVGHYPSENVVLPYLKERIEKKLPQLEVFCSNVNGEVFRVL